MDGIVGDTMGKQISKKISREAGTPITISKDFDDVFSYFEDYIFVGGPRVTFAFGWKF